MAGPWEKYASGSQKPWEKYANKAPDTPELQSALEGALQGGTFGFGDELEGAARGAYKTLTGDAPSLDAFSKNYSEARDSARARAEKAQKDNPNSYLAGELGGGVASSLLPAGGIGGLVSKGAGALANGAIAKGVLSGAGIGAIQGFGTSKAPTLEGGLEDAKSGGLTGALVGGAIPAAVGAFKNSSAAIDAIPKKLANTFLSTPEDLTEAYIANPERIKNAPSLIDVAKGIVSDEAGSPAVQEGTAQLADLGKKTTPEKLVNLLKRINRDQSGATSDQADILKQLGDKHGKDYLDQVSAALQKEAFDKSQTNGSKNVKLFSEIFADSKLPFSKVLAPSFGAAVDKYGRKMTMSAIDAAVALKKQAQSQTAQEFQKTIAPLVDFARQGDPTAILTFQLLNKSGGQEEQE